MYIVVEFWLVSNCLSEYAFDRSTHRLRFASWRDAKRHVRKSTPNYLYLVPQSFDFRVSIRFHRGLIRCLISRLTFVYGHNYFLFPA